MNTEQTRDVLATMIASRLYGHELRLRVLGLRNGADGIPSRAKLWCMRCHVSHEFETKEGCDGQHAAWWLPCAAKA